MRRRPVKHCHSAAVSAWHVRHGDAITILTAGVDAVSDFCFLEDSQVHVCLGHPPQRRLQSPVTTVTDIIGAKLNRHCPPCRPPSTAIHPLPTDSFFTLSPAALPVSWNFVLYFLQVWNFCVIFLCHFLFITCCIILTLIVFNFSFSACLKLSLIYPEVLVFWNHYYQM